ncbi:Qat anti-phage system QueC-like protein QatC [Spirosoma pomorum]
MNVKPILLQTSAVDTFTPDTAGDAELLVVDLTEQDRESTLLQHKVYQLIDQTKLTEEVQDLLNMTLMAYAADQAVSREMNGYLNWSRHFRCYVPVKTLSKWIAIQEDLQKMLSFLSGDKWEFVFRQGTADTAKLISKKYVFPEDLTKVCLFSGGLDSFIGAIDLLQQGEQLALVGHHKKGGGEGQTQEELFSLLKKTYHDQEVINFPFYVQPNQAFKGAQKEVSSRARSILFIGLGLAVANCCNNIPLIIPENGFISLNVPLTFTRHGSHSTRTTHPYFLHSFQQILSKLGIPILLDNPYQFKTKGEMVSGCGNPSLLKVHFKSTLSCAHPDQARFKKMPPGTHCGYCTPCLIRRASLEANGLRDTKYVIDVQTDPIPAYKDSGRDPRAFRLALERYRVMDPKHTLIHIMNSGPLSHFSQQELINLTRMYRQGMQEVEQILPRNEPPS